MNNEANIEILNNQDDIELQRLIDGEAKTINKSNKFKLVTGVNNHFLPNFDGICKFFDFQFNAPVIYQELKKINSVVPSISDRSLYSLHNEGVGASIFKKFALAAASVFPIRSLLLKPNNWDSRALKLNSNAGQWLSTIHSFKSLKNQPNCDYSLYSIYVNVINFIEQRCHLEIEFCEKLQQKILSKELDQDNFSHIWKHHIQPFYQKNTQLDKPVFDSITSIIKFKQSKSEIPKADVPEVIKSGLTMQYEFLLNAIAHYELSYVAYCINDENFSDELLQNGIVKTLNSYIEPSNTKTCFNCYLSMLQLKFKEKNIDISNRDLASHIEINHSPDSSETLTDAQYNQLKKWYKRQDLPSNQKLQRFLSSLIQSNGFLYDDSYFFGAKIMLGFDTVLIEKTAQLKNEFGSKINVESIWKQVLSNYPNYYEYHFYKRFPKAVRSKTQ